MNPADAFALARDLIACIAAESKARHARAIAQQMQTADALRRHARPVEPPQNPPGDDDTARE